MCGIAGFAGTAASAADARSVVGRMCDAIAHRGPDSDGYFVADGVALGMRRLSVIDVAGGQQPISNEDGTVTVVFNGEIYNHHALRRELEQAGHAFRTRSDTEVLVHLYEEYGQEMAARLHGMFAFAIWDSRKKLLLVARDRAGMKPLSYRVDRRGIVFCSELRSMWAYQSSELTISPRAVLRYLAFGYVPDPDTIFDGVRKLPPGHTLLWTEKDGPVLRRFWSTPKADSRSIDSEQLVRTLRDRLDAAVASHLESEVPLGAFLSGGLDSSTVVSLMSKHASGRVRTFSIGFSEAEYDESPAARAVATHFSTEHTEYIVRPDVADLFEGVVGMFDEPFADSSAIPTFLVAQLARQSVTVALSGDGGDELFGGYSRYQEALGHGRFPLGGLSKLLGALGLMLPHAFPGRNKLVDLGRSRWGRYAATVLQPTLLDEGGIAAQHWPDARRRLADHLAGAITAERADDFANHRAAESRPADRSAAFASRGDRRDTRVRHSVAAAR